MQKLTQKWSLISLLEPVAEGYEFFWKDYPLHVTLASVFAVEWDDTDLLKKLTVLLANKKAVTTRAVQEGYWGDKGQYHVMLLEKTPAITNLHQEVHKLLLQSGAKFNQPEFEGEGYVPHSTIQKHARLYLGETIQINSLTLLDMFPNQDGYQRKIGPTISFKN